MVTKMKIIFWICLVFSINNYYQTEPVVNLSFNLNGEQINDSHKKIVDAEGVTFYIDGNYFHTNKNSGVKNVQQNAVGKKNFKSVRDLIKYKNELIEKEIKKSKNKEVVYIISNEDVFKQIFIYEKTKNNSILEYPVTWLEVIECQ
jgi:hypothetical protein